MSDFTPGPWMAEGPAHSLIVWGPELEQRVCFMTSDGPCVANARLIAAAPDMLEALRAIELARHTDAPADWERASRLSELAMAKATGGQSND